MVKGCINGKMVSSMKETTRMIKNMEKGSSAGQMADGTKAIGKMVSRMEKVFLWTRMVLK